MKKLKEVLNRIHEQDDKEFDKLSQAIKSVKGVKQIEPQAARGKNKPFLAVLNDGDELEMIVMKNGKVVWTDFQNKTLLGNINNPKSVAGKVKILLKFPPGDTSKEYMDFLRNNKFKG